MTGQKDNPDDLIAELTKLMAADNRGDAASARPAAAPAPEVRIPGQPGIRIPGVSHPVAAAPAPSPGPGKFDFGQPARPAAPPPAAPEPRTDWQDRLGIKAKPEPDPLSSFDLPSTGASTWRPAIAPGEADPQPAPAASSFNFDFGFNRERPSPQAKPAAPAQAAAPFVAPAPRPVQAAVPAPVQQTPPPVRATPQPAAPALDPIAELIAAELGAQMQAESRSSTSFAPQAQPASAPVPQAAPMSFAPYSPAEPAPQPGHAAPAHAAEPAPARQAPPAVQQRQAPENDRFSTAPVFGLGNRITGDVPAPRVELDPMDEIENLIGEAVRVELNMPQPTAYAAAPPVRAAQPHQPPQPTPTVPPLGTQFAPRRTTSLREPEFGNSADEAILAAAAAGGAEVGRIDSAYADERPARQSRPAKQARQKKPVARDRRDMEERRSGSTFKQLVVPAIAGTILLAGGLGLYWALGMSHNGGQAPVLTADATPAKTIPAKPVDAAPHSVVMDELSGNAPASTKETLVSRDQTAGTDATQVATAAPAPTAPAATTDTSAAAAAADNGLANRKVRTVTVRPDGSIVSSDDSVAGSSQLPVSRPNVPTVPGAAAASSDATVPAAAAPAVSATLPAGVVSADAAATAPLDAGATETADTGFATGTPDANAPIPLPPPTRAGQATAMAADSTAAPTVRSTKPTSPVNAVIKSNNPNGAQPVDLIGDLASGTDQPATAPASKPAASKLTQTPVASADATGSASGTGHVQLSSQTSQAAAEASAASLTKKFGSLWGGAKPQIVKVDLGAKGIYYRVVLPMASAQEATALCGSIKSSGGDCVANR